MEEQLAKDLPLVTSKLTELNSHVTDATSYVNNLLTRVKNDELPTEDGLSFLELKHHLLLQYVINLTYSMLMKVDGRQIDGSDVIDRLVEIRVVLEKMRPIDKKLKYQVDKLLKMASSDVSTAEKHPLNFKPNIDMLASKDDDEEEDEDENEADANDNTGVYVPPKVSAVPYEEEENHSKRSNQKEKVRQRALNSSLLKDLREEYSEEPEEIRDGYNRQQRMNKLKEKEKERERFEEDNMRRLQLTKKDRQEMRKLNEMDDITKFDNFRGFASDSNSDNERPAKKRKGSFKSKGKKFKKRMQKRRK